MSLVPDHLVVCVFDLDEAGEELASRYGLDSVPGGRHSGHGTANRIVPLGDAYIEVVAVVDVSESANSRFGSWVATQASGLLRVNALCLRTDDIVSLTIDRDIESVAMSRARPDGSTLSWRVAGIERTITDGWPFFIEWNASENELPGRTPVDHPAGVARLEGVEVVGDKDPLKVWVSGASDLTVSAGSPATTVSITTSAGVISL